MSDTQRKDKGRCDSDSIGCVAGGLSGAHNGARAIPREWAEAVENHELLLDIGKQLAAKAMVP